MVYPMDKERAYAFGRGIAEIQQASDEFKSECDRFNYDLDFLLIDPVDLVSALMGDD